MYDYASDAAIDFLLHVHGIALVLLTASPSCFKEPIDLLMTDAF